MAELTTDDGSTASPEAIRRFEERNNAMPDQTTDHPSGAVDVYGTQRGSGICSYCGGLGVLLDKPWKPGRETMTCHHCDGGLATVKSEDRIPKAVPHFIVAAEDKGRSEERERIKARFEDRIATEGEEIPAGVVEEVLLASLDSEPEGTR